MKKSAIALAVAAAMAASAAAQAETTFYGSLRPSIEHSSEAGAWGLNDRYSRWGVKGSEDLGNGLSAIYQVEAGINIGAFNGGFGAAGHGFRGRLAWAGLKGGFGALTLGTQWSPFYDVVGRNDIYNVSDPIGTGAHGAYAGPYRLNNSIAYKTPDSIPWMQGEALMAMSQSTYGGTSTSSGVDLWNIGANFSFGPAGFGATYLEQKDSRPGHDNVTEWGVSGSYEVAGFTLGAGYQKYKGDVGTAFGDTYVDGTPMGPGKAWQVTGQYAFANNILRAGYYTFTPDNLNGKSKDWTIGVQHNLSKRTRVWAEYMDAKNDPVNARDKLFSLGFRHDF